MSARQDIDHVFVGMDDGSLADAAIAAAVHVGRVLDAKVEIVHALNEKGLTSWMRKERESSRILAGMLASARENRMAHLRSLQQASDLGDVCSSALTVHFGKPSETLLRLAESGHALIVLGPHHRDGLFDFGGTTREVLSAATCPVWVQREKWAPVRRVLAAIDLSDGSAGIVAVAARMATLLGAELTILHAFQAPVAMYEGMYPDEIIDRERARVEARFQEILDACLPATTRYERQLLDGLPANAILRQQESCGLIVMGTHGQSMFERVMLGSEAHRVLRRAERPVIVVPQRPGRARRSPAPSDH